VKYTFDLILSYFQKTQTDWSTASKYQREFHKAVSSCYPHVDYSTLSVNRVIHPTTLDSAINYFVTASSNFDCSDWW